MFYTDSIYDIFLKTWIQKIYIKNLNLIFKNKIEFQKYISYIYI